MDAEYGTILMVFGAVCIDRGVSWRPDRGGRCRDPSYSEQRLQDRSRPRWSDLCFVPLWLFVLPPKEADPPPAPGTSVPIPSLPVSHFRLIGQVSQPRLSRIPNPNDRCRRQLQPRFQRSLLAAGRDHGSKRPRITREVCRHA